jgi:hypothetical protein
VQTAANISFEISNLMTPAHAGGMAPLRGQISGKPQPASIYICGIETEAQDASRL